MEEPSDSTIQPTIPSGEPTSDERLWALLAHLSYFILAIVGPLLIWLLHDRILKHHSAYVEHHAKQATIYQIAIYGLIMVTCGFGAFLWPVFMIFSILAAIEANKGRLYSYPLMTNITAG